MHAIALVCDNGLLHWSHGFPVGSGVGSSLDTSWVGGIGALVVLPQPAAGQHVLVCQFQRQISEDVEAHLCSFSSWQRAHMWVQVVRFGTQPP